MRAPRILVVDDNRISQQVIGALLGKGGWQFHTASDGFAAIDAASRDSYQLILMDLQMPGMDGIEATARLRQLPGYAEIPVMALTADVSDQVRAKCREAGMNAFLDKPIHTVELNALLGQFLTSPDGD
jgi:CheY-like chemotaxis protein